jgi:hypothetical protein
VKAHPAEVLSAAPLPRFAPPRRAVRVSLFEREIRERLASPAVDILLGAARVLSEGGFAPENPLLAGRAAGQGAYFGSCMLTIELSALCGEAGVLRDPSDEPTALRLANLCATDARLLRRVRLLAEDEATRIAGRPLGQIASEVRVRAEGTTLFVDIEVEAALPPRLAPLATHAGRAPRAEEGGR